MFAKNFLPNESITFHMMLRDLHQRVERFGFIPHSTSSAGDIESMRRVTGINDVYEIVDPTGKVKNVGLRVDHTVPFSEFVHENRESLVFPFKRYVTQKIWRSSEADELTEIVCCDVDIIGRDNLSLVYDAEIIAAINHFFNYFNKDDSRPIFSIHINNRKIIVGFLEGIGVSPDKILAVKDILGKKDYQQLSDILSGDQMEKLKTLIDLTGSNQFVFDELRNLSLGEKMRTGINELVEVADYAKKLGVPDEIMVINPTMTREMYYYTGTIYQTFLNDCPEIGSVCHGGRYTISISEKDEVFPGVGISIPLTNLFTDLLERNIITNKKSSMAPVMVSGIGSVEHAMYISTRLRDKGIKVETFFDTTMPIDGQIKYARKRGFKYLVWTDPVNCDVTRPLVANDIIMVQDLSIFGKPESSVCWGFFTSIENNLQIHNL